MNLNSQVPIVKYLQDKYAAHTIILYGSNIAMEPGKDIDLLVLSDMAEADLRDWNVVSGLELDAFISKDWNTGDDKGIIRLRNGVLLLDQHGHGQKALDHSREVFQQGPAPQSARELEFIRNWVFKTLKRVDGGDLKSAIRRHEIFSVLLQQYFQAKGWWYEGATASSQRMQTEDDQAYQTFLSGDLSQIAAYVFRDSSP